MATHSPIGIFDSGIGGLSVLRHIRAQLPNESLCYFSDSGYTPYGEKTEAEIMQRTLVAADNLLQHGVKAIVVACNTATAAAIALLRAHYPELILVGVEPGLKPAVSLTKTGCVGVMATSSTLASSKYQLLCEQIRQTSQVLLINQACPGLVGLIEKGDITSDAIMELLATYLQPLFDAQVDTIVLGCTHYPFVASSIERIAQSHSQQPIQLVDTGMAIARHLQRLLEQQHLLNPHPTAFSLDCIVSGDPAILELALTQLLQLSPEQYCITASS